MSLESLVNKNNLVVFLQEKSQVSLIGMTWLMRVSDYHVYCLMKRRTANCINIVVWSGFSRIAFFNTHIKELHLIISNSKLLLRGIQDVQFL